MSISCFLLWTRLTLHLTKRAVPLLAESGSFSRLCPSLLRLLTTPPAAQYRRSSCSTRLIPSLLGRLFRTKGRQLLFLVCVQRNHSYSQGIFTSDIFRPSIHSQATSISSIPPPEQTCRIVSPHTNPIYARLSARSSLLLGRTYIAPHLHCFQWGTDHVHPAASVLTALQRSASHPWERIQTRAAKQSNHVCTGHTLSTGRRDETRRELTRSDN